MCGSPCPACPWRKDSVRGHLGAATPMEFVSTAESEAAMPCHLTVNYEDPEWRWSILTAPRCRGRDIYWANRLKVSRAGGIPKVPRSDEVFSTAQEFVTHHTISGKVPTVMVVGSTVVDWDKL